MAVPIIPDSTGTALSPAVSGFEVAAGIWWAGAVAGAALRARRVRSEAKALAAAVGLGSIAMAPAWAISPAWALGWVMGLTMANLWTLSGSAQSIAIFAGGLTAGAGLYYGGLGLLPAAMGGALAWVGLREWLIRPWAEEASAVSGRLRPYQVHALVCTGQACRLRGAEVIWDTLFMLPEWKASRGARVTASDCLGYCRQGPVLWLEPEGRLILGVTPRDLVALGSRSPRKGDGSEP